MATSRANRKRRRTLCFTISICTGFCLLDGIITLSSAGFYHDGSQQSLFHFNTTEFSRHLTLQGGYSFAQSAFDFFLLLCFRFILLLTLILFYINTRTEPNRSNQLAHSDGIGVENDDVIRSECSSRDNNKFSNRILNFTLIAIQICNFSFSLIKLLAFSDVSQQLYFPGVWLNVLWNICAFLIVQAIYQFWLFESQTHGPLTTMAQLRAQHQVGQQQQQQHEDDEYRLLFYSGDASASAYQPLICGVSNSRTMTTNSGASSSVPPNPTDPTATKNVIHGDDGSSSSCTSAPHSHASTDLLEQQPDRRRNRTEPTKIATWAHIQCLLRYCAYYWGWLAIGFVFLIVYSVARVIVPLYTARVISNIVSTRDMRVFFESIFWQSMLMIVVVLFNGLRAGTMNYTTAQIERRMRMDLFRSVTSQEIAFFDQAQTGEILSRLIADCETMSSTVSNNVNILLRNGLMVVGSFAFMVSMSWRLSLVTVIVIPPIAFFTKLYSVYYDHLSARTQECKANANRVAEEVISSMRNVRAFASERKEQRRFEHHLDQTLDVHKKKSLAFAGFQWMTEAANNVILVAILCYGGYLVLSGRMTSDQMFAFLLYQLQLGENFYMLNSVATGLMESVGASRKVFEYLQRKPRIPLDRGMLRPDEVQGKLEFQHVSFAYPTRPNTLVLKDLSFTARPGEMVALVGPSGAGKSSVIALLEHFYEPLQGQILLDDRPIEQYEHQYFHQKISLVSQEPTLYACSIRENILYGCDENEHGMEDVVAAAQLANIHQFVTNCEHGYETKCGERGVQMSGGQKQRIAIARALVRHPAVLILDEATSALDAESEHVIQEALLRCAKDRTVLLIAHRLSTVERADRIVVLDGGQIVQIGSHAELMAQPEGLYHQLVKHQLLGENNMMTASMREEELMEGKQQQHRQRRKHRKSTP